MKKLVIAEKPSVGREIAKSLRCPVRGDGYLEGNDYIVTWALGHLVELSSPAHYSESYKRWTLESLPMIPETLDTEVIEETKGQYKNIASLLRRSDVSSVIVATDAGREGELVARWILKEANYKGSVERLWISSQTEKAIKEGFDHLLPSSMYDNLYHAAECRSAADWYVGMNVTRALTCFYDAKLSAGRVQTPTLALMTKREDEIDEFLGSSYYSARGDFGLFHASYYPSDGTIRFTDQAMKEKLESLAGAEGVVRSITTEEGKECPPLAYDLTELQRDANLTLGFSAKETLDTLQRLYEVHKIATYPRTDSRYLTEDIVPTFPERLKALEMTEFGIVAKEYLSSMPSYDKERVVQPSLVTDHHAIIPTEQKVKVGDLSDEERKLWQLIALRFLEVLSEPYEYKTTKAVIDVDGHEFRTSVTLPVKMGWRQASVASGIKSAAMTSSTSENSVAILRLKEGDKVTLKGVKTRQSFTTPPERYTDASLLYAMEHAGRFVDDSELKANLSSGIGTPATRAEIIEKLIQNRYVTRDGKYLVPTEKGREVVRLAPDVLSSPALTGEWEGRLERISKGEEDYEIFIKDIKRMASSLVTEVKNSTKKFSPRFKESKKCPYCGSEMMKALDSKGCVHWICQRLSCSYEEKEVKERIALKSAPASKQVRTPDGKIKIVIKKAPVKIPEAYETHIEVVNESKRARRGNKPSQERFENFASRPTKDTLSGGTMADFFRISKERSERDKEKRKGRR